MSTHPHGRRRRRRIRIPVPAIGRRHRRNGPDWPDEPWFGPEGGGVREPRTPMPAAPAMSAAAPEPEPPLVAGDHSQPPPGASEPEPSA